MSSGLLAWTRLDGEERDPHDQDLDRWVDHTTVSPFEEFIAKLERAIKLLDDLSNKRPAEEEFDDSIAHNSQVFKIRYLRNSYARDDFEYNDARASLVGRWFGVKSPYLILSGNTLLDRTASEELLSALNVALGNTIPTLPGFVAYQASPTHAPAYLGYNVSQSLFFESDVAHANTSMQKLEDFHRLYRTTYGLVSAVEKNEGQSSLSAQSSSKRLVSVRLTWQLEVQNREDYQEQSLQVDPLLRGLRCSAVFPTREEGSLFDNQLFSTVTPSTAPVWTVIAIWACPRPQGLQISGGGSYDDSDSPLDSFFKLYSTTSRLTPIALGTARLASLGANVVRPPMSSHSIFTSNKNEFVQNLARRLRQSNQKIRETAEALVHDSFANTSSPLTKLTLLLLKWIGSIPCASFADVPGMGEAAGSTPVQLSEDDRAVATDIIQFTWQCFCTQLRHRFEQRSSTLFTFENEASHGALEPDLSRSLAHQKVALVRFCAREMSQSANADESASRAERESDELSSSSPRGRKRPLDFRLAERPDEVAWEPFTQPACIWTHRESDDGRVFDANVRAELMSQGLTSDMRAFKAANPGCQFVDFVRWFSPKDVVDGCLNPRMESGVWVQAWHNSGQPLEASRQKPLFDPLVVGEKALHWLEVLGFDSLCEQLLEESIISVKEFARDNIAAESDLTVPYRTLSERVQTAQNVRSIIGPFAALEGRVQRSEAIDASTSLPENLRSLLEKGDGSCRFDSIDFPALVGYLLELIAKQRGDASPPDKREFILSDADSLSSGARMYASTSFGELRVARVIAL